MKVENQTSHLSPEVNQAKSRAAASSLQGKSHGEEMPKTSQGFQGQARPALTVHKLQQAIASTPDIDMQKVEALRAEIQAGTYQVNADALAGKLIQEAIHEHI